MSNYTPEPITGTQVLRYYQCFISRPYGDDAGQPYANFREESVVEDAKGKQTSPAGEVGVAITDDNEETEFDLINPGTTQPTGKTMTYAELLQGIDSLYYALAVARDEAANAAPEQLPA